MKSNKILLFIVSVILGISAGLLFIFAFIGVDITEKFLRLGLPFGLFTHLTYIMSFVLLYVYGI